MLATHARHCVAVASLAVLVTSVALANGTFPGTIEYTVSHTRLVIGDEVGLTGSGDAIQWVAVSGDGQKVAFAGSTDGSIANYSAAWRLWMCNADGSGLHEFTPSSEFTDGGGIRYLKLNEDGSKAFVVAPLFGHEFDVLMIDTTTGAMQTAVQQVYSDFRKPYEINADGSVLYFKHDNPVNSDCTSVGVYSATVGGSPSLVSSLASLPYNDSCNRNRLRFLGAAQTGRVLFIWSDQDGSYPENVYIAGDTAPTKRPDSAFYAVWAQQDMPNRIMSTDGKYALYQRHNTTDEIYDMQLIDLDSGDATLLFDYRVEQATLAPDASIVRFNPFDLCPWLYVDTLTEYDTESADIQSMAGADSTSRISEIPNTLTHWFYANEKNYDKLYRVDIGPDADEYGHTPRVTAIWFSASAAVLDDETEVAVYASVTDADGLSDIDWVRVMSPIDYNTERPEWDTVGRAPFRFHGDVSSAEMSDEGAAGELGDETAGDGTYTLDYMKTRELSDFYNHYTGRPIAVPLRIVVKDKSDNYAFADTRLMVTDDPNDVLDPNDPNDIADPNDLIDPNDIGDPNDAGDPNDFGDPNDAIDPNDLDDPNDTGDPNEYGDPNTYVDPNDYIDPNTNGGGGGGGGGICPSFALSLSALALAGLWLTARRRR